MIQAHYVHCALYVYYDYFSSTSDHQALDYGSWGPLHCPNWVNFTSENESYKLSLQDNNCKLKYPRKMGTCGHWN